MGLLDHLPEPKPIGSIDVRRPERNDGHLYGRAIGTLVVLIIWMWGLIEITDTTGQFAIAIGLSAAYAAIATFVHPEPEMSNVGFLGGLINHPFRISDDINRFLLFFYIVLAPGRFVGTTVVDLWRSSHSSV